MVPSSFAMEALRGCGCAMRPRQFCAATPRRTQPAGHPGSHRLLHTLAGGSALPQAPDGVL